MSLAADTSTALPEQSENDTLRNISKTGWEAKSLVDRKSQYMNLILGGFSLIALEACSSYVVSLLNDLPLPPAFAQAVAPSSCTSSHSACQRTFCHLRTVTYQSLAEKETSVQIIGFESVITRPIVSVCFESRVQLYQMYNLSLIWIVNFCKLCTGLWPARL
ncbi:hypothetical protein Cgig2_001197 [Carnegiea gigantea]|uniref:Uncharacterized protein n=1 Tax=Carnegiea gigantea TaxID=171969 RepID=A0A9Q1JZY9_9CARY|nr:hypothetical protein Cgig2_001197 [Carnegiea gigantea]